MSQPTSVFSSARWLRCTTRQSLGALAALCLGLALLALPRHAHADRQACLTAHEQGQVMRLRGQYQLARQDFAACMEAGCPSVLQQDCAALLAELDAGRTSVVFTFSDASGAQLGEAQVFIDGRLHAVRSGGVVLLDPGRYELRVAAAGQAPRADVLSIQEGEKSRRVDLQFTPALSASGTVRVPQRASAGPAAPRRLHVASYVLGGSAFAVLGAGIALGVSGSREYDRLLDACELEPCEREQTEKGRRLYIAANVAFGVSGALAIAAASVFLVDRLRARESAPLRAAVDARIERGGAVLTYGRSF